MGSWTNEFQFQIRVLSCQRQLQEQHWKYRQCHNRYWWENHSCCWEARQHGWYHQRIWESAAGITWGCYLCRVIEVRISADQRAQQATSLPFSSEGPDFWIATEERSRRKTKILTGPWERALLRRKETWYTRSLTTGELLGLHCGEWFLLFRTVCKRWQPILHVSNPQS